MRWSSALRSTSTMTACSSYSNSWIRSQCPILFSTTMSITRKTFASTRCIKLRWDSKRCTTTTSCTGTSSPRTSFPPVTERLRLPTWDCRSRSPRRKASGRRERGLCLSIRLRLHEAFSIQRRSTFGLLAALHTSWRLDLRHLRKSKMRRSCSN